MIGRKKEIEILNKLYDSEKSQFVAVYGRRRIGKTLIIDRDYNAAINILNYGISHN